MLRQFKIHVFIAVSHIINQGPGARNADWCERSACCHFSSNEWRFDVANEFRVFLTQGSVLSALIEWNKDSEYY